MDLGSLVGFGSSPTQGFKPAFKVGPAGGGGAGGGLLDAAVSLLSAAAPDPWADHVVEIEIVQAPAPSVATCRVVLGPGSAAPSVALGDELEVQLGYTDQLTPVFSGAITRVAEAPRGGLELVLAAPSRLLASLRQSAAFEQQSLGDLARQWCSDAGATPGTIDSGPSYSFVAIDDRRSAWEWLGVLARAAGLYAFTGADGKVHCTTPPATPLRALHYGADLLRLALSERAALMGEVRVTGEGAAGSQGADAWSWLLKDAAPVQGSAGSGAPKRLFQDGALRSQAAVGGAASGIQARALSFCTEVRVTLPGSPDLGVGACFELADCPAGRGDGSYVALRSQHRFEKGRGFTTLLHGVSA